MRFILYRARLLFYYLLCKQGEASQSKLAQLSGCDCPGYNLVFECMIVGAETGRATLWLGTALNCAANYHEILLLHRRFAEEGGTSEECNDGAIVAESLRVEDDSYTSRLNVTVHSSMIGKTIRCAYDNGTTSDVVGSFTIFPEVPAVQAEKVYISLTDFGPNLVTFKWLSVPMGKKMTDTTPSNQNYPAVHYNILASNCGNCPTTTNHTTVTCTDAPTDGSMCTFAVQTVVCGNISGQISELASVRNESPRQDQLHTNYKGALVAAILLAITLVLSYTVILTIVRIILVKGRSKTQTTNQISRNSPLPQTTDLDTAENVAYGVSLSMQSFRS